jgi:acetyl esterase/lipase
LVTALLALRGPIPLRASEPELYFHRSVRRSEFGTGVRSYWLFEPAEPTPKSAPVILFHHGWLAMNPGVYGAWINHLARRGAIVIYPKFQTGWLDSPDDFLQNSLLATRDAIDVLLSSGTHVKPDLDRFAIIGHSTGGVLSVQVAAIARERGLPRPRAVVAVTPGEVKRTRGPDLSRIPRETLLVIATAEHDLAVGDAQARELFNETRSIPPDRKLFLLYRTDLRGKPGLLADHLAATASLNEFDSHDGPLHDFQMNQAAVNALDRSGLWRMTDITLEAAFAGKTLADATEGGRAFRRLGYWTNGRPVIPPIVTNDPSQIPRFILPHGFRLIPWQNPLDWMQKK